LNHSLIMRPCDAQLLGDSPNGGNYQDTPPRLLNQSFNQVDIGMTVLEEVRALEMKERAAKTNRIDFRNELSKFKEALKMNEANIEMTCHLGIVYQEKFPCRRE
jgi:hypothetical protein